MLPHVPQRLHGLRPHAARRPHGRFWGRWIVLLVVGLGPAPGHARMGVRLSYRNVKAGIQIYLPNDWQRQVTAHYPGLLAAFRHRAGARLLLSSRTRTSSDTPRSVAQATARALRKRGLHPLPLAALRLGRLPAVLLDAEDGTHRLRQIVAVRQERIYVLTFWIPAAHLSAYASDIHYILRTARFER